LRLVLFLLRLLLLVWLLLPLVRVGRDGGDGPSKRAGEQAVAGARQAAIELTAARAVCGEEGAPSGGGSKSPFLLKKKEEQGMGRGKN
jgi:hypothetical protein